MGIHFAAVTRHVDDNIVKNALDVVIPADIMHALNHGRGLCSSVAALFKADECSAQFRKWDKALKDDAKEKELAIFQ